MTHTAPPAPQDERGFGKDWTSTLTECEKEFVGLHMPLKGTQVNDVPVRAAKLVLRATEQFRKPAPAPGSEDVWEIEKRHAWFQRAWDEERAEGRLLANFQMHDDRATLLRIVKGLEAELGRIKGATHVP